MSRIKNRIVFRIKTDYKLELLIPETMKCKGQGSTKKDVDKDKDRGNVPKLESVDLVHCKLFKNDYQHSSKVLFTFVSDKEFG